MTAQRKEMNVANAKVKELIAELRRLHADVPPGEWVTAPNHDHSPHPRCLGIFNGSREVLRHGGMRYSDAALVVAMRNALPQLLDALEELERERDELLGHVRRMENELGALVPRARVRRKRTSEKHS
jgi:hypothetical protein